jgi:hypothetical protein
MNVTALQLYEKGEENMAGMIREGINVDKWQVCGKVAGVDTRQVRWKVAGGVDTWQIRDWCGYLAGLWESVWCGYLAGPWENGWCGYLAGPWESGGCGYLAGPWESGGCGYLAGPWENG